MGLSDRRKKRIDTVVSQRQGGVVLESNLAGRPRVVSELDAARDVARLDGADVLAAALLLGHHGLELKPFLELGEVRLRDLIA